MVELNKIYNQDCIEGMKDIDDKSIDLVVTDPPYLFVKGGMKNKKFNIGKMSADSYMNKEMSDFGSEKIHELCETLKPKFKHKYNAYFFCSEMQIAYYLDFAVKNKLRYNVLIWDRQIKTMISYKFFRSNIDYIIRIYGSGNSLNKIECDDVMSMYSKIHSYPQGKETKHQTEKPVQLINELIQLSSNEGDIVLDPFIGSGTTAVSCIRNNRNFIGYEIEKSYFDMAEERIGKEMSDLRLF